MYVQVLSRQCSVGYPTTGLKPLKVRNKLGILKFISLSDKLDSGPLTSHFTHSDIR